MTRHWDRIAKITGHKFDVENENFQLRNIMEAPLLENKEDIEVKNCFENILFVFNVFNTVSLHCIWIKGDSYALIRLSAKRQADLSRAMCYFWNGDLLFL